MIAYWTLALVSLLVMNFVYSLHRVKDEEFDFDETLVLNFVFLLLAPLWPLALIAAIGTGLAHLVWWIVKEEPWASK